MPPLRGVIHCAGVIDDGVLVEQTWERFHTVMSPKVLGTWNLHQATLNCDLQFFIMFSSVASMLGSPGQGNYSAANAFMDAMAYYRRATGLPGMSLNWGAWAEVGMAAALGDLGETRKKKYGAGTIEPQHGLAAMATLIKRQSPQFGIIPMNWDRFSQSVGGVQGLSPFLRNCVVATQPAQMGRVTRQMLVEAPADERNQLAVDSVVELVARITGSPTTEVDQQLELSQMGFDSMMALELKNQLMSQLELDLPVASLLSGANVSELAKQLVEDVGGAEEVLANLDNYSEEQLDDLLDDLLAGEKRE